MNKNKFLNPPFSSGVEKAFGKRFGGNKKCKTDKPKKNKSGQNAGKPLPAGNFQNGAFGFGGLVVRTSGLKNIPEKNA